MPSFTESAVEKAALDWLRDLGYTVLHDSLLPKLISGQLRGPDAERFAEGAL